MTTVLGDRSPGAVKTRPALAKRFVVKPSDIVRVLIGLAVLLIAWRFGIQAPVNSFQRWVRNNELTHPVFRYGFIPVSRFFRWSIDGLAHRLFALPWFVLPVLSALIVRRKANGRLVGVRALLIGGVAALPGFFGLWEPAMQTLSLMTVSVLIALVIGIPLGVLSGTRPRFAKVLSPVLDAMQTVPATVYLIPAVLFFGIGSVPGAIATVIFALPPAVRLTALGVSSVPEQSVEAGAMFGSTKWQLLRKVQLPLAMPAIATGINQTIMMALGIVVVAALVGAGGLGQVVLETLKIRAPGRGFVVGIAIVALATALDRVSSAFVTTSRSRRSLSPAEARLRNIISVLIVGMLLLTVLLIEQPSFPFAWGTAFADPIDSRIVWLRDHGAWITRPLTNFIIRYILVIGKNLLTKTLPGWVVVAAFALLGYKAKDWRLAFAIVCGLSLLGIMGTWAASMETLVQVLTASLFSVVIAIPIGIFVGRRPRLEKVFAPVLDALQTIPSLIYTIPFIMIFSLSVVPGGIIASALYAIPAGIRLAALGIREVPNAPVEAATSFGATQRQLLRGVRIPLALPAIMLAVNQVIMMVLSMVVIAGMTGSGALGYEAVKALTLGKTGQGAAVGISIVVIAMILDRLTQGLADRPGNPKLRS
jgi:glycine betaine/proline transport system permease protein